MKNPSFFAALSLPPVAVLALSSLFLATGSQAATPGFSINLNYINPPSPSEAAAFTAAKATWESIITGYQIDDIFSTSVTIDVNLTPIDGPGGTLGSGGPQTAKLNAAQNAVTSGFVYTQTGQMTFDTADTPGLGAELNDVILSEMGRVLGFGTLWSSSGVGFPGRQELYVNNSGQYTGANALAAYNAEFGQSGSFIPVELGGGGETANGYWNEVDGGAGLTGITEVNSPNRDLRNELMTGWLNSPTFISNTTVQSMVDLGYVVASDPATLFWDGTPTAADGTSQGGAGTWDIGSANWDNGSSYQIWNNAQNDTTVFGGTAGTVTLGAHVTVGGLQFDTDGYTVAPGTGPYTVTFGAAGDINVSTGTTTISAAVAGSSNITKIGGGTLGLSGGNTYSGGTTLSAGTLVINNADSLGTGSVSVTGSSSINATGSLAYTNAIDVGAALTLKDLTTTANTAEFSGVLSGSSTINLANSGSGNNQTNLFFSNTGNTFTGNVVGPAGNANGADYFRFNSIGDGGNFTFNKGGNRGGVTYAGSSDITFNTRQIAIGTAFTGILNGNGIPQNAFQNIGTGTVTFNTALSVGAVTGNGTFFFDGTNTGNNTFAGTIGNPTSGGDLGIGKWGTGKWILSGSNSFLGNVIVGNGTLSVNAIDVAANNQPLGKNSLVQLGDRATSGTLEFTGNTNSTTDKQIQIGTTIANGGHIGAGSILNNGTGSLTFTNGTFNLAITNNAGAARTLTLGGTYSGTNEIQGTIQNNTGTVGLTKTGAGTWKLSGDNTYTGNTTVSGGLLEIGGGGTLGSGIYAADISVDSANSGTLKFNSTADQTLGGVISGTGALVKDNTGDLILTAINSFTGNTTISGGTLQIGGNNTPATLGPVNYAGDISNDGTLLFTNNTDQNLSGVISGSGNLQKAGGGTLTLSGANTYTGKTTIAANAAGGPKLSVSSFNSVDIDNLDPLLPLASSSLGAPTTVADGTIDLGSSGNIRNCTLIYTGPGETTDRVMHVSFNSSSKHTITSDTTGGGLLKFTSPFTIDPSSGFPTGGLYLRGAGDGEIAGGIGTIPGFFEKTDAGTWTLGGTNSVNSAIVDDGTLIVSGLLEPATTLTASNGTLTINGSLAVSATTISGATLDGTGSLTFTIDGANSNLITMTGGTLTATGLTIAINPTGSGLTEPEYVLVDATGGGTISGTFAALTGVPPGYALSYDTPNQVKLLILPPAPVASTADDGPGSLRAALTQAALHSGPDIITFDPFLVGPIVLSTPLNVTDTDAVTVDAAGVPGGVTLDGGDATRIFTVGTGADLSLDGLTLIDGKQAGGGGAIFNDGGTLALTRCTLSGNQATAHGGAIHSGGGSLTLSECTFNDNQATTYGGAVSFDNNGVGTVTRCTFSDNHAVFAGGAIDLFHSNVTITHCSISGNTADSGGGIAIVGTLTLDHTIVAGNTATTSTNIYGAFSTGSVNITDDTLPILLAPLGNYGGPTQTRPPLPGSPAIDAAVGSLATSDQRGFPAPTDGDGNGSAIADLGAVERLLPIVTQSGDSGPGSLRQAMADAALEPGMDTILFDPAFFDGEPGDTIVLASEILVNDPDGVIVDATPVGSEVIVSGNNASRTFQVNGVSTATLRSLTLTDALGDQGGAILNSGFLTLEDMTLTGNTATTNGGGIFNAGIGTLIVLRSTISDNQTAGAGGGLFLQGIATLEDVTLDSNNAGTDGNGLGGAIRIVDADVTLGRCTLSSNSSPNSGGGISIVATSASGASASLIVTNSTLANNSTGTGGGAIQNSGQGGNISTVTLVHTTVTGNQADNSGGGLQNVTGGVTTIKNCIVAGNIAASSDNLNGAISQNGTNFTVGDPLLAPLGNYGGPTRTMAPLPGSPVIEGGGASTVTTVSHWRLGDDDSGVTAGGAATTSTDPVDERNLSLSDGPLYDSGTPNAGSDWCLQFTTGSYGTATLIPALTDDFGIELWVKTDVTTGGRMLAYNGDSAFNGWGLYQDGAYFKALFGSQAIFGEVPVVLDTWTHLALVRDSGTATLYVNGTAAGTSAVAPNAPAGQFAIAANPQNTSSGQFTGFLDEVRVFTFAPGTFNSLALSFHDVFEDQRGFPRPHGPLPDIGAYEAGTFANYNAFIWESLPATATGPQHDMAADFDGDGQTNGDEWNALTDPADSTNYLHITQVVRNGPNLDFTFPSVVGRTYDVEYSTDLGSWINVGGGIVGTGSPIPVSLGPVDSFTELFVRVRTAP